MDYWQGLKSWGSTLQNLDPLLSEWVYHTCILPYLYSKKAQLTSGTFHGLHQETKLLFWAVFVWTGSDTTSFPPPQTSGFSLRSLTPLAEVPHPFCTLVQRRHESLLPQSPGLMGWDEVGLLCGEASSMPLCQLFPCVGIQMAWHPPRKHSPITAQMRWLWPQEHVWVMGVLCAAQEVHVG